MQSWIYQQGLKKGEARGEARGELRTLRRALEATLKARGLRLTAKRREQIELETRTDVLTAWFQAALTADRLADVFSER
jgi:predicted transposase YdaD